MRMYPRYSAKEVLNEFAITFFTLLNEGYRLQNQHYQMLVNVVSVPHMEESSRRTFLKQLEYATQDASDILGADDDSDDFGSVAKLLGSA
jgi:hypothetical protein